MNWAIVHVTGKVLLELILLSTTDDGGIGIGKLSCFSSAPGLNCTGGDFGSSSLLFAKICLKSLDEGSAHSCASHAFSQWKPADRMVSASNIASYLF